MRYVTIGRPYASYEDTLEFFVEGDPENGLPWLKVKLPNGEIHNILWLEEDNEEGIRVELCCLEEEVQKYMDMGGPDDDFVSYEQYIKVR